LEKDQLGDQTANSEDPGEVDQLDGKTSQIDQMMAQSMGYLKKAKEMQNQIALTQFPIKSAKD